jgi:hypothetical protein
MPVRFGAFEGRMMSKKTKMADLAARRIAHYAWSGTGLDPEETIGGEDQAEYAETMQQIIDGTGPKWVLEAVAE